MDTDRDNQAAPNLSDPDLQKAVPTDKSGGNSLPPEKPVASIAEQDTTSGASTISDENPAGEEQPTDEKTPDGEVNTNNQPSDLLTLYKQWIDVYEQRSDLYQKRIETAWQNLLADIGRWEEPLRDDETNQLVHHHVVQFKGFIETAFEQMIEQAKPASTTDPLLVTETADFRALLVGVFTAQWLLLQGLIFQRIDGSPYRNAVRTLDADATTYYARLFYTLQAKLDGSRLNVKYRKNPLAPSAPLIHLGSTAQVTVFNRRVPLLLSIPFSALDAGPDSNNSRMSIPHEIAHAIFAQVPELIDEIMGKLKARIAETKSSRREQVLNFLAINWTEEICADLVGTALAGEAFARSARWIMADSEQTVGIADLAHPPGLLRPLIHLKALKILAPKDAYTETQQEFEKALHESSSQLQINPTLHRRFRSVPALMFVRMEEISKILEQLVDDILEEPLVTLSGTTMLSWLHAIHHERNTKLPVGDLEQWGANIDKEDLVLDFPTSFTSELMTPGVTTHPECCDSWLLRPLCCSSA